MMAGKTLRQFPAKRTDRGAAVLTIGQLIETMDDVVSDCEAALLSPGLTKLYRPLQDAKRCYGAALRDSGRISLSVQDCRTLETRSAKLEECIARIERALVEQRRSERMTALRRRRKFHSVQFYESESVLMSCAGSLLISALERGDSAVVIATQAHRGAFRSELRRRGYGVHCDAAKGRYFELDAAEVLSQFMDDGLPHPSRFSKAIVRVLQRAKMAAADRGRGVFAFGEMVALLWSAGNSEAAIALERLWNDLARTNSFALHCAYPTSTFRTDDRDKLKRMCGEHSHLIP